MLKSICVYIVAMIQGLAALGAKAQGLLRCNNVFSPMFFAAILLNNGVFTVDRSFLCRVSM